MAAVFERRLVRRSIFNPFSTAKSKGKFRERAIVGIGRKTWNWKIWPDYVAAAAKPIGWKKAREREGDSQEDEGDWDNNTRGPPYMTSTDFWGSLTPSPSLSEKSMLFDRKSATFLDPSSSPSARTSYMEASKGKCLYCTCACCRR